MAVGGYVYSSLLFTLIIIQTTVGFIDLRFRVTTLQVPTGCLHSSACNLSYAVAILESIGQFDLQSAMLQDGTAIGNGHGGFTDDTVIRLTRKQRQQFVGTNNERLYVGIKFLDLPEHVQDYFIIDASRVVQQPRSIADSQSLEVVKQNLATNSLTFDARVSRGHMQQVSVGNGCVCRSYECACCSHVHISKIHLNDTACLNLSYVPVDYGIRLTFSIDGHVYYTEELSVRNPPPVCFAMPHLKEYASICLRFTNLHVSRIELTGCVQLEAELYHVRVAEHQLGCFHIPAQNRRVSET